MDTSEVRKSPPWFPKLRVVPLPTTFTAGETAVYLSPNVQFNLDPASLSKPPVDLVRAIKRTKKHILDTRLEYLSPSRGAESWVNDNQAERHLLTDIQLSLGPDPSLDDHGRIRSIMECTQAPISDRPDLEAYTLSLSLDGTAKIESASTLGLLRGLTTLEQLFYYRPSDPPAQPADDVSGSLYAPFAPYEINDRPAFGWRGLMLDTSRNWFGKDTITKLLDSMSLVKLNVFHWHITDSNSWPLDLKSYPELAAKGAYSAGQKYSEQDVTDIITYAGERGTDVLLEIDTPGHTSSIALSHPEHIAKANVVPFERYAGQPPSGQLRFATPDTIDFTKGLIEQVTKIPGVGRYVSTGGDEVSKEVVRDDPDTQESLKKNGWTMDQALDNFVAHIHKPIISAGKVPVVWQEMVLDHGEMKSLSPDTIVQVWQAATNARKVLNTGHQLIHATAQNFYLDAGQGGWITEPHGSDSWSGHVKTWAHILSFDPYECTRPTEADSQTAETPLTVNSEAIQEKRKKVLGGQACLWTEQTDETNLDCVIWPRAGAVADLFWTGDSVGGGYPRNAIEALPRIHDIRYRLVDRGVRASPLQPHWCALRPELSYDGA